MSDPVAGHDPKPVDPSAGSAQWALMALDPSGERHLMVREVGSGHQSSAVLFREHGGQGRLSVLTWNKAPYGEARMQRPNREARVAQLLASSARAARFARLLASQDLVGGYRTSWWEFYNVGSMRDLSMFLFEQSAPPLSLVFRLLGQCLEGIQCLAELDIFHMDLHTGNIFLHMADGASYPSAVIGDFGYSRLPGEAPLAYTAWEWSLMSSNGQAGYSSPPLTYGYRGITEDRSWRLSWDLKKFRFNMAEDLLDNLNKDDERNQLIFSLFRRMADMCAQDDEDRKMPEAERPPLQDLTQMIQDAKTLERLYAATTSDEQALAGLRENLLALLSEESLEPLLFDNERAARDKFQEYLDTGLFRMINLADDNSIEAATEDLAGLQVEGSAYVSDYSDKSDSRTDASTSPDSSETRGTTAAAAEASEPKVPGKVSAERRTPASSQASRWTPITRGLAEATAFIAGDASALDALLWARDVAERDQALIRDEHARRYRGQRLRELFRRR